MSHSVLESQINEALALLESGTLYDLLGVSPDANEPEISAAFRERAKVFHVDSHAGKNLGHLAAPMARVFSELSRAHVVLTNRDERAEYDASLELAEKGVPTDVRTIFMADQAFRAGKRMVERNSFQQAAEKLELACQLNPSEADYWAYRHWAEFGLLPTNDEGKPMSRASVREIQKALQDLVDDYEHCVAARVFLGHIHRVEGELNVAVSHYKSALRLDPDNHEAQSSLRIINRRAEKKPSFFERLFKRG